MCQMTITSVYPSQSVSQHIEMNSQVEFFLFPRERERLKHINATLKATEVIKLEGQIDTITKPRLIAQKAKAHTVAFSCSMACILNRATLQRK